MNRDDDDDGGEEDRPLSPRWRDVLPMEEEQDPGEVLSEEKDDEENAVPPEDLPEDLPEVRYRDAIAPFESSSFFIDLRRECMAPSHNFPPLGHEVTPKTACTYYLRHVTTAEFRKWSWKELLRRVQQTVRPDLYRVRDAKTLMDARDLAAVFEAFDSVYFANSLWRAMCVKRGSLLFEFSAQPDPGSAAAYTRREAGPRDDYVLTMYWPVFRPLFTAEHEHFFANGGKLCHSRLECLLMTFAHELCHLLEFRFCETPDEADHGITFQTLAFHLFGFTRMNHGLFIKDSYVNRQNFLKGEIRKLYQRDQQHVFTAYDPPRAFRIVRMLPSHAEVVFLQTNEPGTVSYLWFNLHSQSDK